MSRRKLIDYLNDPTLLRDISVEEMKAWAAEVPYAGLVQKLLAQKLIIEGAGKEDIDRAAAVTILSNANPHHSLQSLDDFKAMILSESHLTSSTDQDDITFVNVSNEDRTAHSVTDEDAATKDPVESEELIDDIQEATQEPLGAEEPSPEEITEVDLHTVSDEDHKSNIEEVTFTSWLSKLRKIESKANPDHLELQLSDDTLASDALAQLLVKQGHYGQAIAMYEKLVLKYPQKSSFFAAQIEKVEAL